MNQESAPYGPGNCLDPSEVFFFGFYNVLADLKFFPFFCDNVAKGWFAGLVARASAISGLPCRCPGEIRMLQGKHQ